MALDANGNKIGFGDYVKVVLKNIDGSTIVRILQITDGLKGASALGGYVSLTGNGRIGKLRFDPHEAELVLANAGEPVKGK